MKNTKCFSCPKKKFFEGLKILKINFKQMRYKKKIYVVRCPKCHHDQKYMPRDGAVKGKSKRCVYCGRNFTLHPNPKKSRIIKEI